MSNNTALTKAAKLKNDEFYTRIETIEKGLTHYTVHFKDKVVFCNCDDPFRSNFVKFFLLNKNRLEIKELIATGYYINQIADTKYQTSKIPYSLRVSDTTKYLRDNQTDLDDQGIEELFENEKENILTQLYGDEKYKAGDFRSEESIALLKEADIVCTNPPFSLFREYVAQLIEYDKEFLIIGNQNAITYKDIFSLIRDNKVRFGFSIHREDREFEIPDDYEITTNNFRIEEDGRRYVRINSVRWFSNIDLSINTQPLTLWAEYDPEKYPKYDNYDAIDIPKTKLIPKDYFGVMGVPISFYDKFCPMQFKILGCSESEGVGFSNGLWDSTSGVKQPLLNGNKTYKRLFIRRIDNDK